MEHLAAVQVTGSPLKPVFKFQNDGILCLKKVCDAGMMPKIG
jgi:hypothetical protein